MPLADDFQEIIDSLPSDWTDLEFDLRVEEDRYLEAAVLMTTCNAQPYSKHDWHWRILVAHRFGHAAAAPAVHGLFKMLDDAGLLRAAQALQQRQQAVDPEAAGGREWVVRIGHG